MLQKLVVSVLMLTVFGAAGVGIYDATKDDLAPKPDVLAGDTQQAAQSNAAGQTMTQDALANNNLAGGNSNAAPQVQPTATPAVVGAGDGTTPVQQELNQFVDSVGDPWSATGTITALDTSGVSVALADGSVIFVELGPATYWQDQLVTLAVGDVITIDGFFNGENYHAATVTKTDGSQLIVRTVDGQPMWSGGVNGQGNGADGATGETQIAPEDWITVEGTVMGLNGSILTVQTTEGELLDTQLGQASFIASQNISFAAGDAVRVLGVWQGTQFRAGEVAKLATGERLMLLDPNGRPLWAGPGRNGNANGQTTQSQTTDTTQTQVQDVQAQVTQGQGQGQGGQGQGQGNGGQGQGQGSQGQGQGQNRQGVQVSAAQWETINGQIVLVEPLMVTIQLATGEQVAVNLGQVDFWTADGIWFPLGAMLTVDGYWLNGQFEAGGVTFDSNGIELTIRDEFGRLLWQDTSTTGQGQGQSGQGGQGQSQGNGNGYRGGRQ